MQYPGAHVKIEVRFGKSRFPLFIDLGFGDLVYVREKKLFLLSNSKGPLFEPSVTIKCYPMEFIFAEKLETVVYRGVGNSRMKDFHDLFTLCLLEKSLNGEDTSRAISLVFKHRKTNFQLPIKFDSTTVEVLQKYWMNYYQSATSLGHLPHQIEDVIATINKFCLSLFVQKI
jgi:hypothetical protein